MSSATFSQTTPFAPGNGSRQCFGNMTGITVLPTEIVLPATVSQGTYLILYRRTGTLANPVLYPSPFFTLTGATLLSSAASLIAGSAGTNQTIFQIQCFVTLNGPNARIGIPAISSYQLPEGAGSCYVMSVSDDWNKPLVPVSPSLESKKIVKFHNKTVEDFDSSSEEDSTDELMDRLVKQDEQIKEMNIRMERLLSFMADMHSPFKGMQNTPS